MVKDRFPDVVNPRLIGRADRPRRAAVQGPETGEAAVEFPAAPLLVEV